MRGFPTYEIKEGSLEVGKQIRALYHPSNLDEDEEPNNTGIMSLNVLTTDDGWGKEYAMDS